MHQEKPQEKVHTVEALAEIFPLVIKLFTSTGRWMWVVEAYRVVM